MTDTSPVMECSFTGVNSDEFDFMAAPHRVTVFDVRPELRGQDRDKGGTHGSWPRFTYYGRTIIRQEGFLIGTAAPDLVSARQDMLGAIYGDITAAPTEQKLGTLTVRVAGGSAVTTDVTVESIEAPLQAPNKRHCPYAINWIAYGPFLDGTTPVFI